MSSFLTQEQFDAMLLRALENPTVRAAVEARLKTVITVDTVARAISPHVLRAVMQDSARRGGTFRRSIR